MMVKRGSISSFRAFSAEVEKQVEESFHIKNASILMDAKWTTTIMTDTASRLIIKSITCFGQLNLKLPFIFG